MQAYYPDKYSCFCDGGVCGGVITAKRLITSIREEWKYICDGCLLMLLVEVVQVYADLVLFADASAVLLFPFYFCFFSAR